MSCWTQATVEGGSGGRLVWRYGDWTENEGGSQYIKNIACEVVDIDEDDEVTRAVQ